MSVVAFAPTWSDKAALATIVQAVAVVAALVYASRQLGEARRAREAASRPYVAEWIERQPWRKPTEVAQRNNLRRATDAFGSRPMSSIKRSDIEKLVRRLIDDGLAPGSVANTLRSVSSVFKSAMADRVVASSPTMGVRLPRAERVLVHPLETAQVHALAEAIAPELRAFVLLGAGSGLRVSELLAVTTDRLNFLKRELRVDRQIVGVAEDGSPIYGPPKTPASTRVVPLSATVVDLVAAHLAKFPANDDGLIFHDQGRAWKRQQITDRWRSARRKAKLPESKPHDLRHHFASVLIAGGCSVKVVSSALGHTNAAMTLGTYSHLFADDDDRVRAAVDVAFAGPESTAEAVNQ